MCSASGLVQAQAAAQAPVPAKGRTTILAARVLPPAVPPGKAVKVTYNWDAVPMGKDYAIYVHILNEAGTTVCQDDHAPTWPTMTSTWSGKISYTRRMTVPENLPNGSYRIVAGVWSAAEGRQPLSAGKDVNDKGQMAYEIGSFKVDSAAPAPPLDSSKPKTLDLSGYKLTFSEEFDELVVSPHGPIFGKTRWTAHKTDDGNFGDAAFTDPQAGFPFKVSGGMLSIEARKDDKGQWRSGLLCSNDMAGNGFAQQYGYFEMRARMPEGPGTWPAFWLLSQEKFKGEGDPNLGSFEIDILEQYGRAPQNFHANYHWWYKNKEHRGVGDYFIVEDMTKDFHNYGFFWDAKEMVWYFDGVELWRQPTPPEARAPFYILVNLALGSGWPIDKTPNPSIMLVDYVRVYAKSPTASGLAK